jgi:uncharacterized protein
MEFLCHMTPEERTLISTLFDRLDSAGAKPKDPQADEYIRTKVSQQPAAPYLLVQSTLVMQQALTAAQTRIADLEKQLSATQRPGAEPSGSFLSGVANLFGVGQPPAQPARGTQNPPPLPSQSAPLSKLSPPPLPETGRGPAGGSFLQSALSTAAGVAGGALLFQGIQNLLGHNPGQFGGLVGPSGGTIGGSEPVVTENTEVVNNVFETDQPPSTEDQSAIPDDPTASLDPEADTSVANPDPGSEEFFASDEGGDFFGDDDSIV